MEQIEVGKKSFDVAMYRRNYYHCRRGNCGRTGTLMLLAKPRRFTFDAGGPQPRTKNVNILVICESCGREWAPSTGPALRALRHQ